MNKHFKDATYYVKRAGQTAFKGLKTELAPVIDRGRSVIGNEAEPEPTRIETLRSVLQTVVQRGSDTILVGVRQTRGRIRDR